MDSSTSMIGRVQEALSSGGSEQGLASALERVVRHFAAHMGTIHRLDAGDRHLYLVAANGPIPEPVLAVTRRIPIGKGIAGEAAATGKPVSICNIQAPTAHVPAGARASGASGALCVPIFRGESIVGTLGIGCQGERTFSEAETADLMAAGRAMAEAVDRSGA
jgi:putative methionine-R-sulfoxide reductase with GAF domain